MPPRTAIVVGNGLTIDLAARSDASLIRDWHPARPLAWTVATHDGRSLPDSLPHFYREIDAARAAQPGASDFTLIDGVVKRAQQLGAVADAMGWPTGSATSLEAGRLDAEARHFLGLAYSALDLELRARGAFGGWPWVEYLRSLGSSLIAVMSFNYETVMEQALGAAGVPFFHAGVEPQAGAPLGKPHGSVDYEIAPNIIDVGGAPDYPINLVMSLVDAPMNRLASADLTKPRLHVELVPPMGATPRKTRRSIAGPSWRKASKIGQTHWNRRILVSGWPVDQPELCQVLRTLNKATEVVVANPDARAAAVLGVHARRVGLRPVTWWPNGPPAT